ncbi:hypothetical protein RI367_008133 [Sorochytrium milnesiophthora]
MLARNLLRHRSRALATATTSTESKTAHALQAFWQKYHAHVKQYFVWSTVGSLALNLLWTRQEREEYEEAMARKIRLAEAAIHALQHPSALPSQQQQQQPPAESKPASDEDDIKAFWSELRQQAGNDPSPAPLPPTTARRHVVKNVY